MILCCGEALIDMIPARSQNGPDGFVPHPGGAIFNTAISLGRLGKRVGMLTGLSTDMFGRQVKNALEASHVDTSLVVSSTHPSTLAFVQLSDGHASYSFFDENSAGRMIRIDQLPALPSEVALLFFGGISLATEPGADTYAALCERERDRRCIMIDPNIRQSLVTDEITFRKRLERMLSQADIVKVSDEDLNWIVDGPSSLLDKVNILLAKGPAVVIITKGSEGAVAYDRMGGEINVPAVAIEVVDTVGAGDTFNGGFLAKLAELGMLTKQRIRELPKDNLFAALAQGAKAASITVSRAGANPPWADEI